MTQAQTLAEFHKIAYAKAISMSERRYNLFKILKIIGTISKKEIKTFLDIGCTDGSWARTVKEILQCDAFGIDISLPSVLAAEKKSINAKVVDITQGIPFNDNTFDLITMVEVIEHVFDTDFVLKEVYRILRPGGYFFITTPNLCSLHNRIKILLGGHPKFLEYNITNKTADHIRVYTFKALENQLKRHGFIIIKKTTGNFPWPMANNWMPKSLKKIAAKMADVAPTLGMDIILCYRKPTIVS